MTVCQRNGKRFTYCRYTMWMFVYSTAQAMTVVVVVVAACTAHTRWGITKSRIQIQKCASFNNKLHNFNLLRQRRKNNNNSHSSNADNKNKTRQRNVVGMKQQRATHRPHLPQAKTSERESTAAAIVCSALAWELNSDRTHSNWGEFVSHHSCCCWARHCAGFDRLY